GDLDYLGRIDHQVKVRGYRIELGEVESALEALDGVRASVVVARTDGGGDKRLVAYVVAGVRKAGTDAALPTTTELREQLAARLPGYMVPTLFVRLDSLPMTPNGKVDRKALPPPERASAERAGAYVAPRTAAEEMLAGIFAEVLDVPRVGSRDDFFEAGGHSLLATQVLSRIRKLFGVQLAVKSLFEAPTVAELAGVIAAAGGVDEAHTPPPLMPQPRVGSLPLAFAQRRLWFLDQLEPNSAAYNLPTALRLRGRLDVEALRRAIETIVARHEVLRTTFQIVDGEPEQQIHAPRVWPLVVADLAALDPAAREAEMMARAADEAARPFDLATGPLVRTTLLGLGDEEHLLLVTMHHVVADGWSMGVMVRELEALYGAYSGGTAPSLPALAVQYADFALWQRGWLAGDVLHEQLQYWRQRLTGVPPLELPADRARPAVPSHRGATHSFVVPAALTSELRRLARARGATLYMTLLAAFEVLLHRQTGQDSFAVGTPIANRTEREVEELIGFFVNTLVMRADLSADPSFDELLARVRQDALGAYAHQAVPFERLVEELRVERDLSRSALFQVMFVLQNAPAEPLALPGLTIEPLPVESATSKFDLMLTMEERGGELNGSFEYATDLFDASTIARMSAQLSQLLFAIADGPAQRISSLGLLSAAERRQLLVEWNDTAAEHPRDACLHQLFAAQAARTPDAVAVESGAQSLTYRQLDERANQLAHQLRALGVAPDVRVGICVERSLEMIVGLLGILKAGGAYVPLDPSYPADRLAFMVEDAALPVLLTQAHLRSSLPSHTAEVVLLDGATAFAHQPTRAPASGVRPDHLVYVIYTSGSTGRPKGVCVPHRSLVNLVSWLNGEWPMAGERMVLKTSLSFDAVGHELWAPLLGGGCIVVAPPDAERTPAALLATIKRHRVTALQVVPTLLEALVAEPAFAHCPTLKWIYSGGEALAAELCNRVRARSRAALINVYGPTEATIDALWHPCPELATNPVPIGRPIANTRVYVLDAALEPVPIGVPGEIYLGGAGVARGYFGRAALTAEKFVPSPFVAGDRLYRTGDRGRFAVDGTVEYLGRFDHQVKLRGYRIELGEIEAALAAIDGVAASVVIARNDAAG
ncbi:MAG: linear gramicidin synthase subunit, partial [Myxococcales bacterium]|nr:linear gramicidin synthase subunit [Myxococcales bacterium]